MGERDYYIDTDDHTKEIRTKYAQHIVKMFQLAGFTEAEAQKASKAVMGIETRIAQAVSFERRAARSACEL